MNNINDCHIFGQGDKINDDTDRNGTKIHIVSQLDPMEFVPAELRLLSVLIGQLESSESPGSIPRKHCTTCELNPKKPKVFFEMLVPKVTPY